MKTKYIVAGVVIAAFVVFGAVSFMQNNIAYVSAKTAEKTNRTVQVKGSWVKSMQSYYDPNTNTFHFYMMDDNKTILPVVLAGAKPNNFEIANDIVAKGRYEDGAFQASEVLTKCPSKYQSKTGPQASNQSSSSSLN
ncbi:MAG: cytochrome c maturation protein CcmE [Bacteroidetes bacterium]|jgi:cytochrome c-type biogenesis protein CcmE|nr:cytochrome c maturation protein CcmE [Bacteroidota bacterium]